MEKRDIKILIVEDDVMLNKIYQTKLGLLGYSVYSSYDGDEGLKKADDLMPKFGKPKEQTVDEMISIVQMYNAALGGEDQREK